MSYFTKSEHVRELTLEDFDGEKLRMPPKKGCGLILFYADWCPHCKNFQAAYEKIAYTAQFAHVAALNCAQYPEKGAEFGIRGYPTLHYVRKDGTLGPQPSNRDESIILSGLMRVCGK